VTAEPVQDDPPDLRLVLPAVAAWLVAWQGRLLPPPVLVVGAVFLVAVAVLLLVCRRPSVRVTVVAAVLLCAAAAAVSTAARVQTRTTGPLPELAARSAAVALEATVLDDPRLLPPRAGLAPLVVVRVRVDVLHAAGRDTALRVPVVVLSTDQSWLPLLPSQQVRVEGRLRAAEPGDDVAAVLLGRGPPRVDSAPSRVQRVAGRLREGLRAAVAPLPEDERGLLPGLVVGDVSRLPPDLAEDFRTVGLTHLR
jgi:competence protein ComEC